MVVVEWKCGTFYWYLDQEWSLVTDCMNFSDKTTQAKNIWLVFPEEYSGITSFKNTILQKEMKRLKQLYPLHLSTWYDNPDRVEMYYDLEWDLLWKCRFSTKKIKSNMLVMVGD